MIAYQMAAAIRFKNISGRTISDQDVDNILRALGGGDSSGTVTLEVLKRKNCIKKLLFKLCKTYTLLINI